MTKNESAGGGGEIRNRVLAALVEAVGPGGASTDISMAQVIGAGGLGISSLHLLKVFVRLEGELGFLFEDAAVANASFSTVGDLVQFVHDSVEQRE